MSGGRSGLMILYLCHGIVSERADGIAETVFIAGEIEDIAISDETPVAETSDVEAQVSSVLVAEARSLGESITEGIVEIRGIIAIEGE